MSLPHSATAIIARNETWEGKCATEPYECGWAHEAVVFVRALAAPKRLGAARARVQISPDGMRWVDEGTKVKLPTRPDEVTFARVTQFGNWIRLAADLPRGGQIKILVAISAKA
jgi:hypothetical protein